MIADHMPLTLNFDTVVRLRPDINYQVSEGGFKLSSLVTQQTYGGAPYLPALGDALRMSNLTAGEIALRLEAQHGVPLVETFQRLNRMFAEGVFDEEPPWRPSPGVSQHEPAAGM